jgi:maltose-binding protein MalE
MMKLKKILCLLIIFALLFLLSCKDSDTGNTPDPNNSNTSSSLDASGDPGGSENDEPNENPLYIDDLPDENYNGAKFNMLDCEYLYTNATLIVEKQTGDVIFDSIYLANRTVEERFNIEFVRQTSPDIRDVAGYVKKTVDSGDNAYDVVFILDRDAISLAMKGKYFYPMNELPYINLDKLYWDQELKKTLTIDNTLYFTYGAHMLSICDNINFLVYNKQIASELAFENIYDLVRNGKWTIDKLYEMAAAATKDLNGDGLITKEDRWGVSLFFGSYYPSFWEAEKLSLIAKDENDLPFFNVPGNEKLFNLFEKLYAHSTSGFEYQDMNTCQEVFDNGRALFKDTTMFMVQKLRALETDYGIVPYPAMNEKKPGEPYIGRISVGFPLIVPVTADAERASVIMEALACQYQKRVIPVYYENAVWIKSTRDEESIEILNMLTQNRFIDFGDTYWTNDVRDKYTDIFINKTNNFQSVTEKMEKNVVKILDKAITAFRTVKEGT